jgi:hypothetical protein
MLEDMNATSHRGHLPARKAARVLRVRQTTAPVDDLSGLQEHPDGWYWTAPDGRQQFGPFETCSLARADRDRDSEEAVNEAMALREAERAIGIADWIDPQTGEPAEGASPPHLEDQR